MTDTGTVVAVVVLAIVFALVLVRCGTNCKAESYGQDASIRASVGGLAGPTGLYGYDPITVFANQIAEMKEYVNRRQGEEGRGRSKRSGEIPSFSGHNL